MMGQEEQAGGGRISQQVAGRVSFLLRVPCSVVQGESYKGLALPCPSWPQLQ